MGEIMPVFGDGCGGIHVPGTQLRPVVRGVRHVPSGVAPRPQSSASTEILQVGSPIGSCYRARGQRDSCRQRVYHPRYDCEHGRHASPHRGRHRRCGIAHRSWRQSWHVARRSSADAVGEACASDASCGVVVVPRAGHPRSGAPQSEQEIRHAWQEYALPCGGGAGRSYGRRLVRASVFRRPSSRR